MKAPITIAAMLTLSVAGATLFSSALRAAPPASPDNSAMTYDQVDPTTAAAIRSRLANIVHNATTTSSFNDLVDDLSKADRDRIGAAQLRDTSALDAQIETFRKDFHNKYNEDFNIQSTRFSDLKIYRGADKDHASVNLTFLKKANMTPQPTAGQPGAAQPTGTTGVLGNPRGDDKHPDKVIVSELKPNGTVTDTRIPADQIRNPDFTIQSNGIVATDNTSRFGGSSMQTYYYQTGFRLAAPIQLNLVNEDPMGSHWRLETSNTLTAQGLADSLASHLKTICDNRSSWPKDINLAYRTVSGHVFQALQEVPASNISSEK